jgi:hypothetical protein
MFTIVSMSEFTEMYNDQVSLIGADGVEKGPLKCKLNQKEGMVTFFEEVLPLTPVRVFKVLPNKEKVVFAVTDIEHSPAFDVIPARVVLRVLKQGNHTVAGQFNLAGGVTITNSTGVQVGIGNSQDIAQHLVHIASLVQKGDAPEEQKNEAIGLLQSFLRHPAVVAAIGGAANAVTDRLIKG